MASIWYPVRRRTTTNEDRATLEIRKRCSQSRINHNGIVVVVVVAVVVVVVVVVVAVAATGKDRLFILLETLRGGNNGGALVDGGRSSASASGSAVKSELFGAWKDEDENEDEVEVEEEEEEEEEEEKEEVENEGRERCYRADLAGRPFQRGSCFKSFFNFVSYQLELSYDWGPK
ncbi:hypothetical protein V1478_006329 [Vespula squamosa]|uniref:Uncharacterized protein n=1 Tax=Vespula squamosa TaxID=30214 RepID=A0ABD2B7I5_VESSQ